MKRDNDRQTAIILSIVGIVPVIWLALLIAPSISGGLPEIAANLATLFDNPFSIKLCGDSLKTVLILLLGQLWRYPISGSRSEILSVWASLYCRR